MKYKFPYSRVMVFALLLFSSFSSRVFSAACMDLTNGSRLLAMLHSMDPVHNIIKDTANNVIDKDGSYGLYENITSATLLVTANKVIIDLNGHTITASSSSSDPLVVIDENVEDVIIKNGAIVGNCIDTGIQLKAGAKRVILKNLRISDCYKGIDFAGESGSEVVCCRVQNCHIKTCSIAVDLDYAEKCIFKDTVVCCCEYTGFDLDSCKYNKFEQCKVLGVSNTNQVGSAYGFISLGGLDNLFYECFVEDIAKCVNSDFCTKAAGFRFGYKDDTPETESKIINCCIDSIKTASWGNAYGIYLDMKLSQTKFITAYQAEPGKKLTDLDWSPNCKHLAIATIDTDDYKLRILRFDGVKLYEVQTISFNRAVNAVAWSPDGQYLAVGTNNLGPVEVYISERQDDGSYGPASLEFITFVSTADKDKEILVYKFDCGSLELVSGARTGVQMVSAYDSVSTIRVADNAGTALLESFDGTPLPGNLTPVVVPIPSSGEITYFGNHPTPAGTTNAPDRILRVAWSHDGRQLFATTEGKDLLITNTDGGGNYAYDYSYLDVDPAIDESAKLVRLSFDGTKLVLAERKLLGDTNDLIILDVAPDDKFVMYGDKSTSMIHIAKTIPLTGLASVSIGGAGIAKAKWNPIACCEKYCIVATGTDDLPRVYEYQASEDTLTEIFAGNDANLTAVNWSPDGKTLLTSRAGSNKLYAFNPSLSPVLTPLTNFEFQDGLNVATFNGWSSCGKFVAIAGLATVEAEDTGQVEIVQLATTVNKCVVEKNKIANVCGGFCGIGIFGGGCCNLIDANMVCCSGVPYSEGVYARHRYNLMGFPGLLDNLYANEGCAGCPCSCIPAICECGCVQ
ncbi:hypothetical protein ACFLYU_00430 [Candidatus Dependentiae bacterium]